MLALNEFYGAEKSVDYDDQYIIDKLPGNTGNQLQITSAGQLNGRKTAVISGAGIAGLSAAFELKAKGFDVIVVEKRKDFSRCNIINLNKEAQVFLRKFGLLEDFEAAVAARIDNHKIVIFGKGEPSLLCQSDVSKLQFEGTLPKDHAQFSRLFDEDGIYSVQIKDLQAFLARKAALIGVTILSESEVKIITPLENGRAIKIEITRKNNPLAMVVESDLFFIAEGAHPSTVGKLEMSNGLEDIVDNVCTGENWIYGNLGYEGDKTFVVSMIITSEKTLNIANVIFNALKHIVNVAVTSCENPNQKEIESLIEATARKAFKYAGVEYVSTVINAVSKPVCIVNRRASVCSKGNVFCIGDAVGNSSPLAGLGGTLGVTLVPLTVEKLLVDYEAGSDELHDNFKMYSQAYVNKWIEKSESVKKFIQNVFEKEKQKEKEQEGFISEEICHAT